MAVSELWEFRHLPFVCALLMGIVAPEEGLPPRDHITQHLLFWRENLILAKLEWVLLKCQALFQELFIEIANFVLTAVL